MQKEVTHNEALTLIDALIAPVAEARGLNAPPSAPQLGQCWIIGSAPTGVWAGSALHLACWTSGGWRMIAPRAGMMVRLAPLGMLRFDGSAWSDPQAIGAPAGGTVVDVEARSAVNAIISAMRAQGWLEQN
jgi:hypothetical protein